MTDVPASLPLSCQNNPADTAEMPHLNFQFPVTISHQTFFIFLDTTPRIIIVGFSAGRARAEGVKDNSLG
jgi:hypothetical protein